MSLENLLRGSTEVRWKQNRQRWLSLICVTLLMDDLRSEKVQLTCHLHRRVLRAGHPARRPCVTATTEMSEKLFDLIAIDFEGQLFDRDHRVVDDLHSIFFFVTVRGCHGLAVAREVSLNSRGYC